MTLYNVTIWEDQTYTGRVIYECNYGFETVSGGDQMVSDCSNGVWTHVADCQGRRARVFRANEQGLVL